MSYTPTAYDWILRKLDKAPWPGDMDPGYEFQQDLALSIVASLEHNGFLEEGSYEVSVSLRDD